MMAPFASFVAIDWSGAEGSYRGISIARCGPGTAAPRLVAPEGARWTRSAVADWLDRELRGGRRLLIGLDFAFAMPLASVRHHGDVFSLWERIEAAGAADADFGCASVLAHPQFAPLYWSKGRQPRAWQEHRRRAELDCVAATGTRPESIFKLIGAKQVGKASLTGMRVLRHVRSRNRARVAVWPFEPVAGKSALVEIYPTLFRKAAAHGLAKLRTRADLNAALRRLGSRGVRDGDLSDHDTDALISAAGLRSYAANGWAALPAPDERVRREGWIFGVPMAAAALAA